MNSHGKRSAPDAARQRFVTVQTIILVGFVLALLGAHYTIQRVDGQMVQWLLAAVPLAMLMLWAWEFLWVVKNDDEMMRALQLRVIALSAMLVLLGGTMWGVLERLVGVPALPGFLLLPAFALIYGIMWMVQSDRA